MARKGQFKKGGGRVGHGGGGSHKRKSSSGRSTAIVVVPSAAPMRRRRTGKIAKHHGKATKGKGRRKGHSAHGVTVAKLVGTGIVLASAAGTSTGPAGDKLYNLVQRIPGAKTFGGTATAGLAIGAAYKFTRIGGRLRPLMACAGIIGVVAAAIKIGEAGTAFKWLGGGGGGGGDDYMDVQRG